MNHNLPFCEDVRQARFNLPFSSVALKIIEIADNEKAPVQSLAEVIAVAPLLEARLLRVVNMVPGLPQRAATMTQAIALLGQDHLKSLALGLTVFLPESVGPPGDTEDIAGAPLTLRQLWEHSLGCAVVAERIAAKVDHNPPHVAFVGGFLHDVGRALFYQHARRGLFDSVTVAVDKSIPLSEAETLALGVNHLELGELWSRKASLPLVLQRTIRYHHAPGCSLPDFIEEGWPRIIAIVTAADFLCEAKEIGKGGDTLTLPGELWQTLGLREADCMDGLDAIKQDIEAAREMFGFSSNDSNVRGQVQRYSLSKPLEGRSATRNKASQSGRGHVIPFPSRISPSTEAVESPSPSKLKILVVEDHGSLCEMLSLYFMRYGYHVRTANNGESALAVLATEEIHLVLLDLMLPRLDGFAVLRQLKKESHKHIPYIIVVSAGDSERDRSKVLELGANEYMPKPFHLLRLLERIQAVEKYLL